MIDPEQWVHLPPDVMTVRYRLLTFRLLTRAGSTVHDLLQVAHGVFPFRLFTMLFFQNVAPDLSETLNTPCELDDRSNGFLNFFNGVVGNIESMAALRLIAHVAFVDIVYIDQQHVVLRRSMKVMAPTHVLSSSDVASHIAFQVLSMPDVEVPPST